MRQRSPLVLYYGNIALNDFYRDIDQGVDHFFHAGYDHPPLHIKRPGSMILNLSPRYYYSVPIVEVMNYYLTRRFDKKLSSMALTSLHEAISNSLLWGLLQVKRPKDIFEFHQVIEKRIGEIEKEGKTLTLVIQTQPKLTVSIINVHDTQFSLETFESVPSPYMRGGEIMKLFSDIHYDKGTSTLELTFGDYADVYQTVS